jgi:hypothetical protein
MQPEDEIDNFYRLFAQERVGQHSKPFTIYKFRTMRIDTPDVFTNEFNDRDKYITKMGKFLCVTSLDELPQIFNILKGDMSFVGPRPPLFLQSELVANRKEHGEEEAEISISDLIRFASYYLKLYNRYRDNKIRTIILCIKGYTDLTAGFNCGSLGYNTTVVDISKKDGKKKLEELKDKIGNKEKIHYLDFIFLPLMNSDQKMVDRVKKAIELEEKLEIEQNLKNNIVAMAVVLSDKFLSDQDMSEIWRDYKMVKFFKYVEEQGKKEGEKQGEKNYLKN